MSIQPPKIDNRSYEEIVTQTAWLVQDYTVALADEKKSWKAPGYRSVDRELKSEEVKNLKIIGWILDEDIVYPVPPVFEQLKNRTLNEDIFDESNQKIANKGDVIDEFLAERISNIKKSGSNVELLAKRGTLIDSALAQQLKDAKNINSVRVWEKDSKSVDAGMALIRIFGRMATLVSDRLNQVPDKNFLAFLDLIGTQLLPPQPAKVPLTFSLAEGSSVDAVVPTHTQVAAPPAEGREDEVVFETDRELVVTTAQLKAVFVREPGKDLYSDRTSRATGKEDDVFEAFEGRQAIEHSLYLACDELFALPGNKTVTIKFGFTEETDLTKLPISWSYWDGSWRSLQSKVEVEKEKEIKIKDLPVPTRLIINGKEAQWLRASLESSSLDENAEKDKNQLKVKDVKAFIAAGNTIRIASGSNNQEDCQISQVNDKIITIKSLLQKSHPKGTSVCISKLPIINGITVSTDTNSYLTPEFCFFNTVPIDLSKDFYPFGEQPRFNDTLYIAIPEVLAKPSVKINVKVDLSTGLNIKTDNNVQVAWEVWNSSEWEVMQNLSRDKNSSAINFSMSGEVSVTLPQSMGQTIVNGESSYWIRVRIVNKGNYGTETAFNQSITFTTLTEEADNLELKVNTVRGFMANDMIRIGWGSNTHQDCEIDSIEAPKTIKLKNKLESKQVKGTSILLLSESNFEPPSIKSIKLNGTQANLEFPLSSCQTYNDFIYVNHIAENGKIVSPFVPFALTADKNPTLYLGFDKQFANRPITLFAQVEPPKPGEALKEQSSDTKPVQLVWEYCSPSGWSSLGVQDETKGFAERGLIQFIGSTDLTKSSEFGQELYWLRVRWEAGEFRVPPRLRRILTNTMWATQATTLTNEILGSSDGNPNQIFWTVQKPVIQGEQLEVQEGKIPSPEEKGWVRWQKVRDFYGSGSRDRHYVLDRLTGEVRFGDGQYGMIPPLGRNNIRLSHYQTGGGTRGNLAANTVVQLKTTVPYLDKVTNLEAAGGGAEQESLEQVKERGPKWLRHRDRAVTIQDFEDLTYEASPDVARAKAIYPDLSNPLKWLDKPQNDPEYEKEVNQHQDIAKNRQVKLLIVPKSAEKQPIPSLALIDCVQNYLRVRCTPTVDFQVIAPDWLKISVTADIVLRSLDITDSIQTVTRRSLEAFLHPLTGNRGQGWNFGEQPYESDLYTLLQSIDGVNYIRLLTIDVTPSRKLSKPEKKEQRDKQLTPPSFLICCGSHTLNFTF